MIPIRSLDHVVLRTAHVRTMIRFYRDVLGCSLEKQSSPETGLYQLRAGHSLIDIVDINGALGKKGGRAPDPVRRNMDHFCLRVDPFDEQAIRAHLANFGIAPGPLETHYGADGYGPALYFQDPDGNTVELKGAGG